MKAESRLKELGYQLPKTSSTTLRLLPAKQYNSLLFVSGHGPFRDGKPVYKGRVGKDFTLEEGQDAARLVMLNILASIKKYLGDLDKVEQVIKVLGFVNSDLEFFDQPLVINAASEILEEVFGERGKHARSAIGTSVLPGNIPVEIELVLSVNIDQEAH